VGGRPRIREIRRSEVFAHTSPLYFFLEGRPVVVPESVEDLLQKIDWLIAHTERMTASGRKATGRRRWTCTVRRAKC
jgi:spore maturation protein CgeB